VGVLQRHSNRRDQALELAPVLVRELDGTITYWAGGLQHLYGFSSAEAVGRKSNELLKTRLPEPVEAITAALTDRGEWSGELVRHHKDGRAMVVQSRWFLRRDGDQASVIEVGNDITNLKRVEHDLRMREAQLELVLETVPDGMIVIDDRGTIQSFSSAAERLFGYDASEVIGRNVAILMPSPHAEQHDSYLERYKRTGERRIIGIGRIISGKRRDGSVFPIELTVGEVSFEGKRLFTGFVRDLSERKQSELRLQELQSELVHMSRLTAMGEMASALAHELNQPLSAIANYLKGSQRILERKPALQSEQLRGALGKAADQALRGGQIIRRMRDFVSRGETERRIESLTKLVEEASALGLLGARERGIQVVYHLDPTVDLVLTDKVQIQQVMLNLIRNAIEAMDSSERRELTISSRAAGEGMVEVSVADTGSGIAPEVMAQLFQPFVTTKAQGMGVGLSICKTIVEAHGGQILARPNPGGGTIFSLTLRAGTEIPRDAD
jgi:two-component system, LuxR family, sensor kinase FixL